MDKFQPGRRALLTRSVQMAAAGAAMLTFPGCTTGLFTGPSYRISLAQGSLHRRFSEGEASPRDFASMARQEFDIDGIEYTSQFYQGQLNDPLVRELSMRANSEGVESLLIMVDGEGALGAAQETDREQAVEQHKKWADAANRLGCHSIRVNARSEGSYLEQMERTAEGLVKLAEYCDPLGLNVLVDNSGGLSSNGRWLSRVIETANHPRVGTHPDFGSFTIDADTGEQYNKYQGVRELMPYAQAVSAKSFAFDAQGRETSIDYERMMAIVAAVDYRGWVGIEYEGEQHSEAEGIRLTRNLLQRIREA